MTCKMYLHVLPDIQHSTVHVSMLAYILGQLIYSYYYLFYDVLCFYYFINIEHFGIPRCTEY